MIEDCSCYCKLIYGSCGYTRHFTHGQTAVAHGEATFLCVNDFSTVKLPLGTSKERKNLMPMTVSEVSKNPKWLNES